MSIKNSKNNICSLEDEKETSKQDGDTESQVSKTLTARTAQFISKINILDEDGNIIAIAKMAKPVTKTNSTDYTFKLKIDL